MATNIKSYPNLINDTWKTVRGTTALTRGQATMDFYTPIKMIYVSHG